MDGSTPHANSVSEDIDSPSYVYSPNGGKPYLEHTQYVCGDAKETIDITNEGTSMENNLSVQELRTSLSGYVHGQEPAGQLSGLHETSYQDKANNIEETSMCQEFNQFVSLDAKMPKTLSKSATFSCSDLVQSCSLPIKGRHGLSCIGTQGHCSSKPEGPAYARSLSLPASVKLVSAMKGGREQNGEGPKMNLHVKWAAEVFDPPATSLSHTLRSHQQRPKAKKKEKDRYKHKQSKGKSSRGTGSERKHTNRKVTSSITDTHDSRMQSSSEISLLDKCGCSDVEVLDYAVGQEKCGSSFMRETLTKVHVSVAEAS